MNLGTSSVGSPLIRASGMRVIRLSLVAGFICLWASTASWGAIYHVAITGNDSNPGSQSLPWRTIQKAANTMAAGDTVLVSPGNYGEHVRTKAHGTAGRPITFKANPPNDPSSQVVLKQFRVQHRYQVIEGFNIARPSNENMAHIRVEYNPPAVDGSWLLITNNMIRDGTYLISTDLSFSSVSNCVQTETGDFLTAGFTNGSLVFFGADSRYWYTNHDTAHRVLSISPDGKILYVSGTIQPDPGRNYWGVIYAGNGNDGYPGIHFIGGSGASGVTNCTITHNTLSNLIGAAIKLTGEGHLVLSNKITRMNSYYGIQPQGRNHTVRGNLFIDSPGILWFTDEEIHLIPHPEGGNWYDYQVGHIHTYLNDTTNTIFEGNWVQNVHSAIGMVEQQTNTYGFLMRSNVFVGLSAHLSVSRSGAVITNNTFYRVSYDLGKAGAIGAGGVRGWIQSNLVLSGNAFIDVGSHERRDYEGWYSLVDTTNPVVASNYVAGAEITGWESKRYATTGVSINGGDPIVLDARNPLGADGRPFTADDGLRPLPNSPLARHGIGALDPVRVTPGSPIAHFTVLSPRGWFDATGTAFDPVWTALHPHDRKDVIRPYTTPDALGTVPVTVTFNASNSIGGLTAQSTDNTGLVAYGWDFDDGTKITTSTPLATHTYRFPGRFDVVLSVTNSLGGSDTFTNRYRALANTTSGSTPPSPPRNLRVVP